MRMSQVGPASIFLVLALLTVAVPRASAIPVIRTWEGLPGSIPPAGCTPGPGSGAGTWFSLGWGCDGGSYATPPNNAAGVEFEARIDAKAGAGSVVTLDTAVTLDKLFIGLDFDDELIMANGARLTIVQRNDGSSGSIENLGRLTLGATNLDTDLQISGGTVTLDGSGVVDLSDDTQNRIYGLAPGDGLVNENNVIQGAGQIGVNLLTLENQGIILATGSATLTVDPDAGGMINGGVLRAFGGGTLVLRAPTYANDGGEIDARDLSIVQLNGARIEGGTLRSSGSGVIRVLGSATLDPALPIVNLGLLELPNATILNLQPGTIVNILL